MSTPKDPNPTETFLAPKIFNGPATLVPRIDVTKPDEVFDLATRLQTASGRRLMQVTHSEVRAIAKLATGCAVVASQAALVVELLDRRASTNEIMKQIEQLAAATRPLMVQP